MTAERFRAIVDAYGADPKRWPAHERAAVEAWAAQHRAAADALLDEAAQLDAWLPHAMVAAPDPALARRIASAALDLASDRASDLASDLASDRARDPAPDSASDLARDPASGHRIAAAAKHATRPGHDRPRHDRPGRDRPNRDRPHMRPGRARLWWSSAAFVGAGLAGGAAGAFAMSLLLLLGAPPTPTVTPPDTASLTTSFGGMPADWSGE